MALKEVEKISFELDDAGRINVKRLQCIIRTNDTGKKDAETGILLPDEIVSTNIHRGVINPDDGDYQAKFESFKKELIGQLAVDQELIIQQRDGECAQHIKTIEAMNVNLESLTASVAALTKINTTLKSNIEKLQAEIK